MNLRIVPWLFLGLGGALLGGALFSASLIHKRSREYRPVQATVVKSWLAQREKTHYHHDETDYGPQRLYTVHYDISYVYGGHDYSKLISSGLWISNREAVERELALYIAGSTRVVYVNPSQPSEVELNLGGWQDWLLPVILSGISFVFFCVGGMLRWAFRATPAAETAPDPEPEPELFDPDTDPVCEPQVTVQ